ncbi:tetratricopeptide repeat protein [Pedobacter steynii]|uniref:Uncharacterized protein n=1 Tax=Pedobacter steynii TaxID=430522 RepID=A0A1D7QJ94_9SPHI|nr:hypothetical protein [Pedobacter steynii]AOM78679.1 hypothetical protein BFS30_16755 [Pedobacter steynii]
MNFLNNTSSNLILFFLFCLISTPLFAQHNSEHIYKSWVLTEVKYNDESELPDEETIKYAYFKYAFSAPDKLHIAHGYKDLGTPMGFGIKGNRVVLKSTEGHVMNTIRIEKLEEDQLVLLQSAADGFDNPKALEYHFVSEEAFQKSQTLNAEDVYSIIDGDTIYKESPKVYARFNGNTLQSSLKVGNGKLMDKKSGFLKASFIVFKSGKVDSLKILNSISPVYDELFKKEFFKLKSKWTPAVRNGTPVGVQMTYEVRYLTIDEMMPSYGLTNEANEYYRNKDYAAALKLYNEALQYVPADKENLYKRGICSKMLGNINAACEDWREIRRLGGTTSLRLLEKYCKD